MTLAREAHLFLIRFMCSCPILQHLYLIVPVSQQVTQSLGLVCWSALPMPSDLPHCELYIFCILA